MSGCGAGVGCYGVALSVIDTRIFEGFLFLCCSGALECVLNLVYIAQVKPLVSSMVKDKKTKKTTKICTNSAIYWLWTHLRAYI